MSYAYGSYFLFQLPYVVLPESLPSLPALPLLLPPLAHSSLLQEHQALREEQEELRREIEDHKEGLKQMRGENGQLKLQNSAQAAQTKRRYRKRRMNLEKKFRCNLRGCRSRYSSKIALNCHKRKKHPKAPRNPT